MICESEMFNWDMFFILSWFIAFIICAVAIVAYSKGKQRHVERLGYFDSWRGIETAPTVGGIRFLAKNAAGFVFISEYAPDNVEGDGCYSSVDSCCGYYLDMKPVMWKRI